MSILVKGNGITVIGPRNPPPSPLFKMTVDTTKVGVTNNQSFELAFATSTSVNLTVDWGDGSSDVITSWNQVDLVHSYTSSGTYQVTLDGSFDSLKFYQNDSLKLMSIDNWGTNKWQTGAGSFRTCVNMIGTYTDNPDFTEIISMNTMFYGCTNFDRGLTVDIPLSDSLQQTFGLCDALNSDITITNSSNVLTTFQMFAHADLFNANVSISDTQNVTNMDRMFERCVTS